MDEDEEINILSDANVPFISQTSDILNCEYTVHPQWLLDKPSTNPDCWYNNSRESTSEKNQEEQEQESLKHITTENSITDESGWTEKEKNLLERGIEIFGKSTVRLAQFIGTKTPSEIKYYLKSFYNELHPLHSVKNAAKARNEDSNFLENVFVESQIPCTSEQVVTQNKPASIVKNKKSQVSKKSPNVKLKSEFPTRKRQRGGKVNFPRNKPGFTVKRRDTSTKFTIQKADSLIKANNTFPNRTELLSNEEIVNIKKKTSESSDSDLDIEVNIEDDCEVSQDKTLGKSFSSEGIVDTEQVTKNSTRFELSNVPPIGKTFLSDASSNIILPEVSKEIIEQLSSLDIPKTELQLDKGVMTELEKIVHSEFFSKSTSHVKSIDIYLKLRNHIISIWKRKKPLYVTKSDIRKDFDVPIDNNTLSRIHNILEQIGAINYGCGRVRYVRPLHTLIKSPELTTKIKKPVQPRRFKKKFFNNGEGGCTVTHGVHGEVIATTVVNEDPSPPKLKTVRKQPVYLIYCKPLTYQQSKYNVKLHISALLLMDFHAHSSLSEVMGLIGGSWCPDLKTLSITHYEPCKNLASSTTHCDMCPVSQAESAEKMHNLKMDLLGWFHSHPTFAPEPSQQDLDTQQALQEWIGYNKPCVGIILAPFNRPNLITPSEYRCMIVDKLKGDSTYLPYKFKVEIEYNSFDVDKFLQDILRIYIFTTLTNSEGDSKLGISFKDAYMYDTNITYMDKFISSAKMTLGKYFPDEDFHQDIVERIQNTCFNYNL